MNNDNIKKIIPQLYNIIFLHQTGIYIKCFWCNNQDRHHAINDQRSVYEYKELQSIAQKNSKIKRILIFLQKID